MVTAGKRVIPSNQRQPGSLTGYVAELGPLLSAATTVAQAKVMFQPLCWENIGLALPGLPNSAVYQCHSLGL
ncbi:hypothetical protein GCM10028773_09190 [Spirosoma koreense]